MSENQLVHQPSKPVKVYTIAEIDGHLKFVSELLRIGSPKNRKLTIRKADEWLDKRLELCQPHPEQNR